MTDESSEHAARAQLDATMATLMRDERLVGKHYGEALLVALHRLWKGAALYERSYANYQRLQQEALGMLTPLLSPAGRLTLRFVQDACFCNGTRVRVSAETFAEVRGLIILLQQRWIGQIDFISGVTGDEISEFFLLLRRIAEGNEESFAAAEQGLANYGVKTITLYKRGLCETKMNATDPSAMKRQSKEVYFSTIGIIHELMDNAQNKRTIDMRKARRLMVTAVDAIRGDESTLLGLANIKNYDNYTYNHSVNVAIYSIALGNRLGLPKQFLNYLGIAGLFHDIGKTQISRDILNKPGALSPEEWTIIQGHPVHGASIVMRLKGWSALSSRVIAGAFEHHLKYDCSGYPKIPQQRKANLLSRIITLADCYDALGRPRVYRRTPFVSERILGMMLERSGRDFDPLLVKVFINMIGIFPLGTLVLLSNGSMGIVTKISDNADLITRPQVTLISYRDGEYYKTDTLDLATLDPDTGDYRCSIIETLDPNDFHLSIEELAIL